MSVWRKIAEIRNLIALTPVAKPLILRVHELFQQCGVNMDDVFRRLGTLETDVSAIKADVSNLKADVSGIKAVIPHLATKADLGDAKALISDAKTSIIQWLVGTTIAAAGVAFAIAKFVH